jgi:uncharacterized phage infection (PIP) family protein YhgE
MGNTASNWNQLEKMIMKKVNNTLNKEVAEQVKEELQTAVSETIYSAGIPSVYERRGGNQYGGMGNSLGTGSIGDIETMTSKLINNGELQVTPEAERNTDYKFAGIGYDESKSLTENLIKGYADKSQWFNEPRNFIETARENMRESKSHVSALADGLRKQGLTVIK